MQLAHYIAPFESSAVERLQYVRTYRSPNSRGSKTSENVFPYYENAIFIIMRMPLSLF